MENERELEKLDGKERVYEMSSSGKAHIADSLKKGILAARNFAIKEKAVVMFVKNAFDEGYVNGTLGVVEDFDNEGMPIVRTFSGDKIFVKPAEWTVEEDGKILAKVEQLPLRLAWAITVHKSQGMSLIRRKWIFPRRSCPGKDMALVAVARFCRAISSRSE